MAMLYHFLEKYQSISKKISLNRHLFGKTIKIVYKNSIVKERYFLHGSIFYLGIYMCVSKPSIKWRNKLLIHDINLTGHRKSACCLQLLVFLEIWVLAPFWHWKSQVFPKSCCHHDLKVFYETGYISVLLNIIENMDDSYIIYPSCERALNNGRVKSKIVRKLSLNFTFRQGSCLI